MKKLWTIAILAMAFVFTACGTKDEPAAAENQATESSAMIVVEDSGEDKALADTAEGSEEAEEAVKEAEDADEVSESSGAGSVLYDDNNVLIEYTGANTDEYGANYLLNLKITNNCDHAIYVTDNDYTFLIDGCQVNGKFSGQNIAAGSSGEVAIEVSGSALEDEVGAMSIDECSEASIGIKIDNADTDEEIDTPMIYISL